MERTLKIFKAVADPTRLRILKMLALKPLCVCEVMSVLDMAQSTASKHLRILADAGFVEAKPGGVWTVYRLARPDGGSAATAILQIVKKAADTSETKRDLKKARKADRNRLCERSAERRVLHKGVV